MENTVLKKFREGQPSLGTFVAMGSPLAVESLRYTGLDYVIVDTEHTPAAIESAALQIQAAQGAGLTALALALLVLLIQNPFCVFSVGLQLSFLSVAGILVLTPRVYACLMKPAEGWKRAGWTRLVRRIWRGVCASVSASLGAMALTIPLMGAVFGQVSLVAPVTNLMVLWIAPFLFAGAFLVVTLSIPLPSLSI